MIYFEIGFFWTIQRKTVSRIVRSQNNNRYLLANGLFQYRLEPLFFGCLVGRKGAKNNRRMTDFQQQEQLIEIPTDQDPMTVILQRARNGIEGPRIIAIHIEIDFC